jgi:hypothetical protein
MCARNVRGILHDWRKEYAAHRKTIASEHCQDLFNIAKAIRGRLASAVIRKQLRVLLEMPWKLAFEVAQSVLQRLFIRGDNGIDNSAHMIEPLRV